jgi:hypothetical protein
MNTSPKCGICNFVSRLPEGKQRTNLISILEDPSINSEKATDELAKNGLKLGSSSVRRHRREAKPGYFNKIKNEPVVAAPPPPVKAPPGWEPYSEHTETIGSAICRLPRPDGTHRDLLIQSGFNPDEWQISGPVNTRKWMRYDQEWLYYYKFDVVAGESPEVIAEHVDELVALIRSRKRKAPTFVKPATDAFVFSAADWQVGKREGDNGTPQTIERVMTSIDMAVERVKELRRQGRMMPTLLFAGTGDLVEGTCGFYPGQQFLIDRNRRDQGRITRELITYGLDQLTPLFESTKAASAGGNHGELRALDGARITSDGDNDDCAQFDAVKEAFDRSGRTDIDWYIMDDELSLALEIGGVSLGLTHGHLFGKGATAQQKALEWWKGQDFGFQPIRGTRILLTSHFHHFSAVTHGSRTHLQSPANDPGSKWVRQSWGDASPSGALTFRVDGETALGWDDLTILHPGKGAS